MNLEDDRFRMFLGAEIVKVKRGYAKVKGIVRREYLNFHGIAHGSYIFSLADFAFAIAANSDGVKRVSISIRIDYYKPAHEGDELVAEAKVVHSTKRFAFCELKVLRGDELIARGDAIAFNPTNP